jgi:hypothetical protein
MTQKKCMTESEWLGEVDPWDMQAWYSPWIMLKFLRECKRVRCKVTDRKLRLFACACCYRMWDLIEDERCREAVRVTERFQDGAATKKAFKAAAIRAYEPYTEAIQVPEVERDWGAQVAAHVTQAVHFLTRMDMDVTHVVGITSGVIAHAERAEMGLPPPSVYWRGLAPPLPSPRGDEEIRWQCAALRDIFTPFRKPPAVDPAWLRWNDSTVPKLAQAIYEERRFGDLPILADALEEAGCTDAGILDHFRRPGEHVRGCWALDLILGKE